MRDQGPGFNRAHLPHAASAEDPFTHRDVREKLGLRAGGFGLLICQGMVDEMAYNDTGNEVTLIKRFPTGGDAALDRGGPELIAPGPGMETRLRGNRTLPGPNTSLATRPRTPIPRPPSLNL